MNTFMVQAHLEYKDHFARTIGSEQANYIILDSGTDTYVIGSHSWTILDTDPICTANLVAFDANKMRKPNCPIITAMTKVQTVLGQEILWIVRDAVYNKGSTISLASEYQSCEFGIAINSVST